jgi:hypothetical protein
MHIKISNPAALFWVYKVKSSRGDWIMTAPLKTIRDIFDLHNLAINRIISSEQREVDLFGLSHLGYEKICLVREATENDRS